MNDASPLCAHLQIREMFYKGLPQGEGLRKKKKKKTATIETCVLVFDQICSIPEPTCCKEVGGTLWPLMR